MEYYENDKHVELQYVYPSDGIAETVPRPIITLESLKETIKSPKSSINSSAANQAIENVLVQGIGKFAGYFLTLITFVLLSRMLTLEEFGLYNIVSNSYVPILFSLAEFGITFIGVRELSKNLRKTEEITSAVIGVRIVWSFVIYGSGIIIAYFIPFFTNTERIAIDILTASSFIQSLSNSYDVPFISWLDAKYLTISEFAMRLFTLLGLIGIDGYFFLQPSRVQSKAQFPLFMFVIIISSLANVLFAVLKWLGSRKYIKSIRRQNFSYMWKLFIISVPMAASGILAGIHYRADGLILAAFTTPIDNAIYGVAYKVINFILNFTTVFTIYTLPLLSRNIGQSEEKFWDSSKRAVEVSLFLSTPVVIGGVFVAPYIIQILNPQYSASIIPLQILIVSVLPIVIGGIYSNILIIYNKQYNLIWILTVAIIANVGLNLYIVPRYTYNGASVVTLITETITAVLLVIITNTHHIVIPSLKMSIKMLLISCLMATALYFTTRYFHGNVIIELSICVVVGGGIYLVSSYIGGIIDSSLLLYAQKFLPSAFRFIPQNILDFFRNK